LRIYVSLSTALATSRKQRNCQKHGSFPQLLSNDRYFPSKILDLFISALHQSTALFHNTGPTTSISPQFVCFICPETSIVYTKQLVFVQVFFSYVEVTFNASGGPQVCSLARSTGGRWMALKAFGAGCGNCGRRSVATPRWCRGEAVEGMLVIGR